MSEQDENPAKRQRIARDEEKVEGNSALPAEMFDLVLSHMDVNERIACRAVCKYFKQVVEKEIKIRSLAIAESEDSTCEPVIEARYQDYAWGGAVKIRRFSDHFYFISNDPVFESDALISQDTATGLRNLMNCFDLSCLRRLFVVEVRNGSAHFDLLNRLVQLEHLQIGSIDLDSNLKLQLPNLRTLSIAQVNHQADCRIVLATPNLKNFETKSLSESIFKFQHPRSVTFVQMQEWNRLLYQLKNLEVLICEYSVVWFDNEDRVKGLSFSAFPKLKRVDCVHVRVKEIRELFYRCRQNSVDFYFAGVKIENLRRELGCQLQHAGTKDLVKLPDTKNFEVFYHYDRLADELYVCEGMRYGYYLMYFPESLPENFARKFYGVRQLWAGNQIENVNYFIEVLKCFRNLKEVSLESTRLTQDFFDRHSHLFARVQEFVCRHRYGSHPRVKIDFKFILNFKYLEVFWTDQKKIKINLLCEAFKTLKYLRKFAGKRFIIGKEGKRVICFDRQTNCPERQFSSKLEMLPYIEEQFPSVHPEVC